MRVRPIDAVLEGVSARNKQIHVAPNNCSGIAVRAVNQWVKRDLQPDLQFVGSQLGVS